MAQVPAGYDAAAWRQELQPARKPMVEGQMLLQPDGSLGGCCPDVHDSACRPDILYDWAKEPE